MCNGSNDLTLLTLPLWLLVFPRVAMAGGGGLVQTAVVDVATVLVAFFFFKSCLRVWAEAEKTFEKLRGAYQMLTRRARHKQFPLASNGIVITVYIHGQKITQSFGVFRRETCETICIAALTDNLVLWKRQK